MLPHGFPQEMIKDHIRLRQLETFYEAFSIDRYPQYGKGHFVLAYYAAFPALLTPDLLYRIWLNFGQYNNQGNEDHIHRVAVSDLLLSPLFKEIRSEEFEMHTQLRNALTMHHHKMTRQIPSIFLDARAGNELPQRTTSENTLALFSVEDIAHFTLAYLHENKHLYDEYFVEQQWWTAKSYVDPIGVKSFLAKKLYESRDQTEKLRYTRATRDVQRRFSKGIVSDPSTIPADFNLLVEFAKAERSILFDNFGKAIESYSIIARRGKIEERAPVRNEPGYVSLAVNENVLERVPGLTTDQNRSGLIHALLVGIEDYHPKSYLKPLRGCLNDINAVELGLQTIQGKLVPDLSVTRLVNEEATFEEVLTSLEKIFKKAKADDHVFLFFVGHTRPTEDTKSDIILYDSEIKGGKNFRAVDLENVIQSSGSDPYVFLVLDSGLDWLDTKNSKHTFISGHPNNDDLPSQDGGSFGIKIASLLKKAETYTYRDFFCDLLKYYQEEAPLRLRTQLFAHPSNLQRTLFKGADINYRIRELLRDVGFEDRSTALRRLELPDSTDDISLFNALTAKKHKQLEKQSAIFLLVFATPESQHLPNIAKEKEALSVKFESITKGLLIELIVEENPTIERLQHLFCSVETRNRIQLFHFAGIRRDPSKPEKESYGFFLRDGLLNFFSFLPWLEYQQNLRLCFLNSCKSNWMAEWVAQLGSLAAIGASDLIADDLAMHAALEYYDEWLAGSSSFYEAYSKTIRSKKASSIARTKDSKSTHRAIGKVHEESFSFNFYSAPWAEEALNNTQFRYPTTRPVQEQELVSERIESVEIQDVTLIQHGTYTDERDGQVYETIEVNSQIWFATDLNFDTGKGSWDNKDSKNQLGRLYQWETAQEACPIGWKLPTDQEWQKLAMTFGGYFDSGDSKQNNRRGDPNKAYKTLYVGGIASFKGRLGGWRDANGKYHNQGKSGHYWSRSSSDETTSWFFSFSGLDSILVRDQGPKDNARSVRCLRQNTTEKIMLEQILEVSKNAVHDSCFTKDRKHLVVGLQEGSLEIWDLEQGKRVRSLQGHSASVSSISLGKNDRLIISASDDQTAKVWDFEEGNCLLTCEHQDWVNSAVLSTNGKRLLSASADSTVKVWDVATGKTLLTIAEHDERVTKAIYSLDETRIISSSYDTTVKIWDSQKGKLISELKHSSAVLTVSMAPEGKEILVGQADGRIVKWDLENRKQVFNELAHEDEVWSTDYSLDGKQFLTTSKDGTAKLWATEGNDLVATFIAKDGAIWGSRFSDSGNQFSLGLGNGKVAIWKTNEYVKEEALTISKNPFGRKMHVLCVGIDYYLSPDIPNLEGCQNDVEELGKLLKSKFDIPASQYKILVNEEATRENIIISFRRHFSGLQDGDTALFYFSGHGSREPTTQAFIDAGYDVPGGEIETMMPYNGRQKGVYSIADKELLWLINEVQNPIPGSSKAVHFVLILEECGIAHRPLKFASGVGNTRLDKFPYFARSLEDYLEGQYVASMKEGKVQLPSTSFYFIKTGSPSIEMPSKNGKIQGIFFSALSEILSETKWTNSYPTYERLGILLQKRVMWLSQQRQFPLIEYIGNVDPYSPFLNFGFSSQKRSPWLMEWEENWIICQGQIHGLVNEELVGHQVPIFEKDDHSQVIAYAELAAVNLEFTEVKLLNVQVPLDPLRTYAVIDLLPAFPLKIVNRSDNSEKEIQDLLQIDRYQQRFLISELATYELHLEEKHYSIIFRRHNIGQKLIYSSSGIGHDAAIDILSRLGEIARWEQFNNIQTPRRSKIDPQEVQLSFCYKDFNGLEVTQFVQPDLRNKDAKEEVVVPFDPSQGGIPFRIEVEISKESRTSMYFYLLYLKDDFGIQQKHESYYKSYYPGEKIVMYDSIRNNVGLGFLEEDKVESREIFVLIASTEPLNFPASFEQEGLYSNLGVQQRFDYESKELGRGSIPHREIVLLRPRESWMVKRFEVIVKNTSAEKREDTK